MSNKKELNEIRQAVGVKLKKKEVNKPQVIQNVNNVDNENNVPTEDALQISFKLNLANKELIELMKEFNKLLNDNTLLENKTVKNKENEQNIVNKLAIAAVNVENLSPGQGLLGLCILSLRQSLSLRDAGNYLAYKIHKIEENIKNIETKINNNNLEPDNLKKEYLKELANKMGLEIKIS